MVNLIGKPDFTFLLITSEEEGLKRIRSRDPDDSDIRKAKLYPKARKKMESFLIRYEMPYIAIDTTNLNAEEVVDKILELLPIELKNKLGLECKE
jgi:thymidylate kinase